MKYSVLGNSALDDKSQTGSKEENQYMIGYLFDKTNQNSRDNTILYNPSAEINMHQIHP